MQRACTTQCPALTCVIVNYQGTGMIPGLQRVKLHCYLHGITNPKSPDGGIHREGAATQRQRHVRATVGDSGTILLLQSTPLQLTCASKKQTSHSQQKKTEHRGSEMALLTLTSEEIQLSEHPVVSNDLISPILCIPFSAGRLRSPTASNTARGWVLRSTEMVRAICLHNLTLTSSGICLSLPPINSTSRDANVRALPVPVTPA